MGGWQLSFGIYGVDLSKPPVTVCLFVVRPLVDLKWTQIIVHIKRIITKLSSAKKGLNPIAADTFGALGMRLRAPELLASRAFVFFFFAFVSSLYLRA